MRSVKSLVTVSALLSTVVLGINHDCTHIRAQGKSFNLEKLGGPHSVFHTDRDHEPRIVNTTWTVDFCDTLNKDKNIPSKDQCPAGTNICGIQETWNSEDDPDKKKVERDKIPVAGSILSTGSSIEPYYLRLNKTDDSPGGLRVELNGGKFGKMKQKAIIEFLCDKDRSGNEGADPAEKMVRRADDDEDTKNSLKFISYKGEDDKDVEILRLQWKTKYVCEDFEEDDDDDDDAKGAKKSSWGFFTWFIVILFLGVAAYLIFGSWLNYNRYGARGWDLLPHGDTIRDVPYIFKDFSRKVLDTFSGGGSRGGYSAV